MAELPAVFHCQSCKARLNITGQIDAGSSLDPKSGFARQQQSGLTSAALDLSRIDESFILLDDRRPGGKATRRCY